MAEENDDSADDMNFHFLGWIPVAQTCHVCNGDVELPPAGILATSHHVTDGVAYSLAAQACSCCIDTADLQTWVKKNDPWDEVSEELEVYCPDDTPAPALLDVSRFEPRCIRCKLMPVDMVALHAINVDGSTIYSTGALGQLCRSCYAAVGEGLSNPSLSDLTSDN